MVILHKRNPQFITGCPSLEGTGDVGGRPEQQEAFDIQNQRND
jgi:hypothetical protein